jgi:hypothetical protein
VTKPPYSLLPFDLQILWRVGLWASLEVSLDNADTVIKMVPGLGNSPGTVFKDQLRSAFPH